MEEKKEIPKIFYLYLHSKIAEITNEKEIRVKELDTYLFQWKIPKKIRPLIIKELEVMGLIKRKNRQLIIINKPKFNIDNLRKYHRELQIF